MKTRPRLASSRLETLLKTFPAVLVVGPRQCGKTTLVRTDLPGWQHLDLERPLDRDALAADVEGFLNEHPRQVVFDEAQHVPELFQALRHALDHPPAKGRRKGRYVLLGSASPSLMRNVSETLAGRIAVLELTPFTAREFAGSRYETSRWFWGGYAPVQTARTVTAKLDWLDAYVTTFLERDLPALGLRLPAPRLRRLWTMLTHVHGRVLTVSDLARSLTVSSHTVNHYLDVLEGAFLIRRLHPHHANIQKRLTKAPKVYVRDTGLLHFLAGLRGASSLETWPSRGASFEGLVVEELLTHLQRNTTRPYFAFWRTQTGAEVDVLIDAGKGLVPIEIKLKASISGRDVAGLRQCMSDLGLAHGYIVCRAQEPRTLGGGIEVVPWQNIVEGTAPFAWLG